MNTYAQLDAFLGKRGTRTVQSIRATEVHRLASEDIAVRYHYTDVVTAHQDGTFTLNSGGFRTSTTKARIREYSPAYLYQKDFEWFIANGGEWTKPVKFYDGIRVDAQGNVLERA